MNCIDSPAAMPRAARLIPRVKPSAAKKWAFDSARGRPIGQARRTHKGKQHDAHPPQSTMFCRMRPAPERLSRRSLLSGFAAALAGTVPRFATAA
ncbi:hypothetical protein E8M68_14680, partial [Neisseria gonorrhoeae]